MIKLSTVGIAALLVMSTQANADEVWKTNTGDVVYEAEMGPTAVWTYGSLEDPGVIYLLGLAKVYENRGSYRGYWAKKTSKQTCDTLRPGILGEMTAHWGRFDVKFIDKNFPSRWEATWSYCEGEDQAMKVEATPLLGNQPEQAPVQGDAAPASAPAQQAAPAPTQQAVPAPAAPAAPAQQ